VRLRFLKINLRLGRAQSKSSRQLSIAVLDNQLTDGGEVVTLYPQEDSWYSFLLEVESTHRKHYVNLKKKKKIQ
jgi:hypothetical protein